MTGDLQLTLDGREVPHQDVVRATRAPGFTAAQQEILRTIRLQGFVTSTEAGRIMHACRDRHRCTDWCRGFHASDGRDAMVRLRDRGMVVRLEHFIGWTFA